MRKICTKRDTDTFDWDEAVIYMTCTDRFFDGNTKNDEGVNKSGSLSYHGYWAKDFTKLNPYLGTEEELESLINALHKRGMKLMVDVVLNHAGYGTEDYFNSILKDQDGNSISMIRDKDTTITGDDVRDSLSGLPDFVTENADVRNQLVEWQTEWMTKYDIDYYRVDTVKHVDATTWAAFKNSLTKANPDFKMIGEYAGAGYANTAGELGTGTMDSLLDFDFNDKAEALKVFKVAAALQITAKGQAVIYYGEEIGQHGLNNYPIQSNRYDFDWNQVDTQSADANSMLNHYEKLLSIRNEYKKLFARGDRSSVLASDDDGYDVFTRSYNGTKLYVGLNIKDADQTISIPVSEAAGSTMTDLYSGKTYTVSTDGKVEITIPKAVDGGTVILKKETSSNGGSSSSTGTTETVKNDTTTVTNPDGSKTETTVIKDLPADTKASLNVTTDANGNKTSEASVETKGTEKKSGVSTSVSADVVKAITDKAKTTDVTIKQEVKKADGSTAYTVEVSAGDVKAGENLKLLKKDAKTGELVLVNKKDYTVSADGSVDLTIKNSGEYVLLNSKDAKAAVKEIKKTVKATKTSTNVKKKKTTKFPWSKKLNMANVDKITYTSSKKSVVTVNKNGKITAKKKGTAKVKAVVTLKDGTKKTVTMKVKVK
ncbi:MAG: alpha-amylase family glycosyl hydrolase [Agathobacter sp.]|nr:alpha-amylase family glycosyl hydrolase [Lachnospiraceae bacterium]MDY2620016.1 alpha-amylase family glycosyl hydrolase [Agathobacter sp.]